MGEGLLTRTAGRVVAATVAILVMGLAVRLARPVRYVVDGLSMAPDLMPGDVVRSGWIPAADRWREPRRFERWVIVPPNGVASVKRVAGLPGEDVAVRAGDLVVNGRVVLKPPSVLAEVAVPVARPVIEDDHRASLPEGDVLDDVAFASEVNRPLEAVGDVGLVAALTTGSESPRARFTAGPSTITWQLPPACSVMLVAGRLDGHLVAVAWRHRGPFPVAARRSGLPGRVPDAWTVAKRLPEGALHEGEHRICLEVGSPGRIIEAMGWRDGHLRPAPDGTGAWQLGGESYLLLGDFPTGSIDSRAWGPLARGALRERLVVRAADHRTAGL